MFFLHQNSQSQRDIENLKIQGTVSATIESDTIENQIICSDTNAKDFLRDGT